MIAFGIRSCTYSIARDIVSFDKTSHRNTQLSTDSTTKAASPKKNRFPIEAAETLYRDGSSDVRAKIKDLITVALVADPAMLLYIRQDLASASVDERIRAITILECMAGKSSETGAEEERLVGLESRTSFLIETLTAEAFVCGLLKSLESPYHDSPKEVTYRMQGLQFIWNINRGIYDDAEVLLFVQAGLLEFYHKWDHLVRLTEPADPSMPPGTKFKQQLDRGNGYAGHLFRMSIALNETCQLGLIDWDADLSDVWHVERKLSGDNPMECTHRHVAGL